MGRKLEYLVIHCTATPEGRNISSDTIRKWHTAPKPEGRGWRQVGYSDMIHLDGGLENLTPFNQDGIVEGWEVTNGVRGINAVSRHVVYVGGVDEENTYAKDTRTPEQKDTLEVYVKYMVKRHPDIKIAGHNQFASKACPSFDTVKWCKSIGIDDKNIHS
tara:strand:+ start:1260 stop:1739 length:480 start_codon:yes stop_codon:yes gene_type:complete